MTDVNQRISRATRHMEAVQRPDGCWEGEVVWNAMLLAQRVIVRRIVRPDAPVPEGERLRMIRYFEVSRTPEGGFGLHPESGPYVFFTAMAYVAIRLLGVGPDEPLAADARRFLRGSPGGVLSIPSWGKFWLSMLGLYDYEGVNPVVPELFLLPRGLAIHPDRYYCHTRYIYLAIAYLYGKRFIADIGPIRDELRRELFDGPFDRVDFAAHRHDLAASDLHVRPGAGLRIAYDVLHRIERARPAWIRRRALARCLERIEYEVRASRHQGISPVNGLLNVLALHAANPAHPELDAAIRGVEAWRWDDEAEGIRYAGARSNAWDTAFAMRAVLSAPRAARPDAALRKAYVYLRDTQMTEELPGREAQARDPIEGGWCFSDGQHRWPVSDCTAEALSAILEAHAVPGLVAPNDRVDGARLRKAVSFILARQNDDGGFGSYERRRGGAFLEALNPSEMYGNCMTERSYLECTASCVGALARARAALPGRDPAIDRAISRGAALVRGTQREDGSWPGFWGVSFTYGIFHAVEALRAAGARPDDPAIARAAAWLRSKQKADGGWGEHWSGCIDDRYVEHAESQVIMTSWAVLALSEASPSGENRDAAARGIARIASRQRDDGGWPEEGVAGVFFGTAMLHYRLYRDYFPAWAMGRFAGGE